MIERHPSQVFLDLIAERLAFERTGALLYDALLLKLEVVDLHPGTPTREDLQRIRDDELMHFGMLREAMESLGAHPAGAAHAVDAAAVVWSGLVQSVSDPRVPLIDGLKAILIAELVDNDGWLLLADLAARLGHDDLAARFRDALAQEEEHLACVREWINAAIDGQVDLEARGGQPASFGNSDARDV